MAQYIDKAAIVAEIERLIETNKVFKKTWKWKFKWFYRTIIGRLETLEGLKAFLDTPEVKEMDITKMADEYYDALMEESDWMDVDTMEHCRFAYYNGCKDVIKAQKGE